MRMRLLSRFAIGFSGALVVSTEVGAFECTPIPVGVEHAVAQVAGTPLPEHLAALYDLHPGGAREALVYLSGSEWCGSGGCTLLVFEQHDARWHPVSRITLVRPPIRALPVASGGWAALFVQVSGGGIINGYTAELPFGANGYASNPTIPPAHPITGQPGGVTIIGAHGCGDHARVAPDNSSMRTG